MQLYMENIYLHRSHLSLLIGLFYLHIKCLQPAASTTPSKLGTHFTMTLTFIKISNIFHLKAYD